MAIKNRVLKFQGPPLRSGPRLSPKGYPAFGHVRQLLTQVKRGILPKSPGAPRRLYLTIPLFLTIEKCSIICRRKLSTKYNNYSVYKIFDTKKNFIIFPKMIIWHFNLFPKITVFDFHVIGKLCIFHNIFPIGFGTFGDCSFRKRIPDSFVPDEVQIFST